MRSHVSFELKRKSETRKKTIFLVVKEYKPHVDDHVKTRYDTNVSYLKRIPSCLRKE